jgi:(2R)-sulfolactate sulfo-lyase subunit alpha
MVVGRLGSRLEVTEECAQPPIASGPGAPHFLIHNKGEHVAVAVQDVGLGPAHAVYMDSEKSIDLGVVERVPLGHKVALADLASGANVIEYGVPVGRTRRVIHSGELVHVHNLKNRRRETSE